MKLKTILALSSLLLGAAAVEAQQQIIPVNITARIVTQSTNTTDVRGVTVTPPPRTTIFSNRDILRRIAEDQGTTFPRGARLAVVDGGFAVVSGTNILSDISSIIRLDFGTASIQSGRRNDTNDLASPTATRISIATLTFDDTGSNNSNGLRFTLQGVLTTTTTDGRVNPNTGVYTQSDSATFVNGNGEGTSGVGSGNEQPIIVTGTLSGAGSNRLTLPL
jgi:hypothetical protein